MPGVPVDVLAQLPVAGIKDSSGDAERLLLEADEISTGLYTGHATLIHLAGAIGCSGTILALANVDPEGCLRALERRWHRAARADQRPPQQRPRRHRRPQASSLRPPRHQPRDKGRLVLVAREVEPRRSNGSSRQLVPWLADSEPVAVRIGQVHLAAPGVLEYVGTELARHCADVAHAEVDERA